MEKDHAVYQVSLKVLIRKGDKVLFLKSANGKYLELPGGRINKFENKISLEKILSREIKEETGNNLIYKLGDFAFQYRRLRHPGELPIFFTVYEAKYLSGDINLSSEHSGYHWLIPKKYIFKRKDFREKGEYSAFKKYLNNHE